jgi:hypothetical protein
MENPDQKKYSEKALLAFGTAVGCDNEAFDWLMNNDYKELGALTDVLVNDSPKAMEWLKNYGFNHLVAFTGALLEEEDAINYLMENNGKNWLATAEMINGSDSAQNWLVQFFPEFAKFAELMNENATGHGMYGYKPRYHHSVFVGMW